MSSTMFADRPEQIFPLRDHTKGVAASKRFFPIGGMIEKVEEDGFILCEEVENHHTVGDWQLWRFWPGAESRGHGSWATTWPTRVVHGKGGPAITRAGSGRAGRQTNRRTFSIQPILNDVYVPTAAYKERLTKSALFLPTPPRGMYGLGMVGTNEKEQSEIWLPADGRIIAPHVSGEDVMGSLVCDLEPEGAIATGTGSMEPGLDTMTSRLARVQTMMRVVCSGHSERSPWSKGNGVAWLLSLTGQGGMLGWGLTYGGLRETPKEKTVTPRGDPAKPPPPTTTSERQPGGLGIGGSRADFAAPESAAGASGAPGGGQFDPSTAEDLIGDPAFIERLFGPVTGKAAKGLADAKASKSKFGVGFASQDGGGPWTIGDHEDQHVVGQTTDSEQMMPVHVDTNALYYMNREKDAPLDFSAQKYPKCSAGPIPVPVNLCLDEKSTHSTKPNGRTAIGLWRWWTTSTIVTTPPTSKPPPPTTQPPEKKPPTTNPPPGVPPPTRQPPTTGDSPPGRGATPGTTPGEMPRGIETPYTYERGADGTITGGFGIDDEIRGSGPSRDDIGSGLDGAGRLPPAPPSSPDGGGKNHPDDPNAPPGTDPKGPGGGGKGRRSKPYGGHPDQWPGGSNDPDYPGGKDPDQQSLGRPIDAAASSTDNPVEKVQHQSNPSSTNQRANATGFIEHSFLALSFRGATGTPGATDMRYSIDPGTDEIEAQNYFSPHVANLQTVAKQPGGNDFDYSQDPGASRKVGGTADGVVQFMPPEFDTEDLARLDASADGTVEGVAPSDAGFAFADGSYLAFGHASRETGGMTNGAVKAMRDVGDSDRPLVVSQRRSGTDVPMISAVVPAASGTPEVSVAPGGTTTTDDFVVEGQADLEGTITVTAVITPGLIGADQNDYNPTDLASATVLRLEANGAARTITGLAAQEDGRDLRVYNVGATHNIVLANEGAGSSAANRFAIGTDLTLAPGGGATLWYDTVSDRWRAR